MVVSHDGNPIAALVACGMIVSPKDALCLAGGRRLLSAAKDSVGLASGGVRSRSGYHMEPRRNSRSLERFNSLEVS